MLRLLSGGGVDQGQAVEWAERFLSVPDGAEQGTENFTWASQGSWATYTSGDRTGKFLVCFPVMDALVQPRSGYF